MSIRISYIVPVYNGERYLSKCLDSIYQQELHENEFEIICIDDCSVDASMEVLKEYERSHSNIKTICHERNKRTGTSCNEGLKAASGDYVWIVGQDDWLEKGWGRRLLEETELEDLDLLLFNYYQRKTEASLDFVADKVFEHSPVMTGVEFVRSYFEDSFCAYLLGFEWRALYRREYLLQSGIGFTDGAIYEDTTFLFRTIWYSNRIKSLDDFVYNYRINEESITDANKRYNGWLAYEFAFVAGKEVLDLSKKIDETKESAMLYRQALWYFRSFVYKVIPMPYKEKRVFYNLVANNWDSVKSMVELCPVYVRVLTTPHAGICCSIVLKPVYLMKHLLKKKRYYRGI